MRRSALTACLIVLSATFVFAQDTGTRVSQIFEDLEICSVDEIWDLASELEAIGEPATVHLKRGLVHPVALVRLASAKTLLGLDLERDLAVKTLVALLRPEDMLSDDPAEESAIRVLACELLVVNKAKRKDVQPLTGYIDFVRNPDVKIAMAKVMRKRGRNSDAVRIIKNYLESDDFATAAKAALALAEVGDIESAKEILTRLSSEPTSRGELARKYLEREKLLATAMASESLARDPQIAALREQLEDLEAENKELKAAARLAANDPGPAAGGSSYPLLDEIMSKIDLYYVTDEEGIIEKQRLLDEAIKGMVASLDPFSSYLTEAEWNSFIEGMSQEYEGIGAYVNKDPKDGYLVISRPFYKGPAYRAGLRSLDKIVEVEGVSTSDLDLQKIIAKLKGPAGTKVKIKVFRRGWEQAREFEVVREDIEVKSVHHEMLPGNIGYLSLSQFGQDAATEVEAALTSLEEQGMEALLFDLRNNGGGYLNQARDVADKFLPAGKVVCYSKGRNQVIAKYQEHKTSARPHPDFPVVVLINGASASASEIVSGALKDHDRALLVGETSFGKGSVQQLLPLDESAGRLRLTIARYYLPSGVSIHEVGVEPDITIGSTEVPVWKREALAEIQETVANFVADRFAANKELFHKLSAFDGYDPANYPDFAELFAGLDTDLTEEDVRGLVRAEVRRVCQDDVSRFFPTDLQEDVQLQRAIFEVMSRSGLAWQDVDEYQRFGQEIEASLAGTPEEE